MINSKYFLQGILASKKFDSPAIALGASFVAIGALLKNLGFTIQESIFSTLLTYALPGSLVMAESMLIGASLVNIFLAVWLVNSRLYPMTVSIMPLLKHESQPKWKYYLSCHFVAVSSWLILKSNYEEIERKYRIDFWIGIGTATWLVAIFSTIIGYYASDFLNRDMIIALAIINPIYFMCAMIGVMKTVQLTSAILLGALLGPILPSGVCLLAG
jgi:predicted branched-subunit amino acid permease